MAHPNPIAIPAIAMIVNDIKPIPPSNFNKSTPLIASATIFIANAAPSIIIDNAAIVGRDFFIFLSNLFKNFAA